jgi:hypothetical protein
MGNPNRALVVLSLSSICCKNTELAVTVFVLIANVGHSIRIVPGSIVVLEVGTHLIDSPAITRFD